MSHKTFYQNCKNFGSGFRPDPISILDRLESVKQAGPGRWSARCPAHQDKHPSLSIRELPDGRILLHCFTGCPVSDIVAAVGLELSDLFPREALPNGTKPERRPFPAIDALRALAIEARVVALAASDIAQNKPLLPEDLARVQLAADRISAALSYVGGRYA